MISPDARVTVQRIGLHRILLCEFQPRYPERLAHYIDLLRAHPGQYAGCLSVAPSREYKGLYDLLDGHHRLCAYILMGRSDALCIVIEEEEKRCAR
ncbi:MAG: ParB N-terminal domain-containing protein [Ktedonobacteraceae bacterium]